jgi:aminopeptidase N
MTSVAIDESKKKKFRFSRSDFGPLELLPLHYDLIFDMDKEKVRVIATQTYLSNTEAATTELKLNQHDLNIESVEYFEKHSLLGPPPVGLNADIPDFVKHVNSLSEPKKLDFEVKVEERFLLVRLPFELKKGEEIVIKTVSTCKPTDNILEGIYYDYTPKGAPQTMITQCQQYGFQRIVPCVDRMASKTFYTTTIVADERYTNVVTNGDLAPGFYDGKMNATFQSIEEAFSSSSNKDIILKSNADSPTRKKVIKYYNHKVNMAPYLFFLGCGTYDVYTKEVEYPDGDTFLLEILCLPGIVTPEDAETSLVALRDSILWLLISTGPEATEHNEEREEIYKLLKARDELKVANNDEFARDLSAIRAELKALISKWNDTGYKYTGSVYREIAMENSNYGGMY